MRKKIIDLSKKLIEFKTDRGNLKEKNKIVDFVEDYFENLQVNTKRYYKNGLPSIVINLKKEKSPRIFLVGHLDVVSAIKKDFVPQVKQNKLFGRGSGDMKTSCAVMMEVMRQISKQKKASSVGLMLTTDEEIGGFSGVNYLLNDIGYKSKFAIVPDGGKSLRTVTVNEKGVLHIKIFSKGRAAHGSRPFLGDNAADKLIQSYLRLRELFPCMEKRKWENTMNLGRINSGQATNQVPDHAEIFLDFRYTNKQDSKTIINKISNITKNFEVISSGSPFIQNEKDAFVKKYAQIAGTKINQEIIFNREEGASDARFFCEKNIPTVITKIKAGNIHGENEWVDLDEMEVFYHILIDCISEIG